MRHTIRFGFMTAAGMLALVGSQWGASAPAQTTTTEATTTTVATAPTTTVATRAASACDPNYESPAGQPCVPAAPPDHNCKPELEALGIHDVKVIGSDDQGLDRDNDGIGCETPGSGGTTATTVVEGTASVAGRATPNFTG